MEKKSRWTLRRTGVTAALGIGGIVGAWALMNATGLTGSSSAGSYVPAEATAPRLTPDQYRTIIADTFGPTIDLGGRFEPDMRVDGLLAVGASSVSVTAAGIEQYDTMADTIAQQVVMNEKNRDLMIPCKPASETAPDDACAAQFFSAAGRLLFRRPLDQEELQVHVAAANTAATTLKDFYSGLAMGLSAMLSSPQFLFRVPTLTPDPDQPGQYQLDAYSKASRLSFFLWNAAPDMQLLAAAEKGELDTRRGLSQQVERMMASPRMEDGVRAFFSDMFHFDTFETLSKDAVIFPKFSRRDATDAQEQTLKTLVDLLLTQRGDYRDVFTTKKTFLTPSLAAIYKVPLPNDGPNGGVEKWAPFEFPADDPRGGILSHVSFTALHSPAGRSSPTLRGQALREIMMCQKVPAPPAAVEFTVVQDTHNPMYKTVRERLLAHATAPSCAGCHKIMDPMGLALENFDGSGEYRTTENGVPIDTSGELDGIQFDDPLGLGQAVRDNPAITSCLVDRVTSYALGRVPATGEKPWVAQLKKRFAEAGYVLPELMREIATSEEFYRVAAPKPAIATQTAMVTASEVSRPEAQ